MLSPRTRILFCFLAVNLALVAVATVVISSRPAPPPVIQGVLLPQPKPLDAFSLRDHNGQDFTNHDLLGQWHLVTYGFTSCPDICPTTLAKLARLKQQLDEQQDDLRVLFYSVDHRRDTSQKLSSYVPYFDPRFVGLTHVDDSENPHLPFEQGLGIVSRLVPNTEDGAQGPDDYQVLHGVALFLINPQGQLQAIFKPDNDVRGGQDFQVDTLLGDYLAVRRYLGDQPPQQSRVGML